MVLRCQFLKQKAQAIPKQKHDPLVMTNIAMENPQNKWRFLAGKIHYKWAMASMAMLNNQRVNKIDVNIRFHHFSSSSLLKTGQLNSARHHEDDRNSQQGDHLGTSTLRWPIHNSGKVMDSQNLRKMAPPCWEAHNVNPR
jgi:hypothetical protein